MNPHLQHILDIIRKSASLDAEDKRLVEKAIIDTEKEMEILSFKLDRTEKVKRTTAILLEETIDELEQKRKVVENHNRDLTIEASLERVRVVAMTMNQPEALIEVCKILLAELQALGFSHIRNTQIAIANDEKGSYMNYESYPNDKNFVGEVAYSSHPFIAELAANMRANKDAFFHESISGEALADWRRYIKRFSNQPTPKLDAAQALHYYYYSIGAGGLGFCTYEPLGDQDMQVLRRFRNVFDLAYRRYTDIELAVAQAREANIEASLERVRATAMAMHKPEDMLSICRVIFQQLDLLGVKNIRNTQTVILNDSKQCYTNYEYFNLYDKEIIIDVAYSAHPIIRHFIDQITEGEDAFFFSAIEGDALTDWRHYLTTGQEKIDPRLEAATSLYYYFYSIGPGALGVSAYDTPMTEDNVMVLKRFRNVFELAYRRYTDIEQAFAQAREAQIEAALERVRSKAMAMQKSDDLANAVAVVFEELDKLNSGMLRCGIAILDPEKPRGDIWITVKSEEGNKIHVSGDEPLDIHPLLKGAHEAWLKQEDFSYILEGEDLFTYYQSLDPTNLQLPIVATFHPDEKDQRHYYFNTVFQHGSLFAFMKTAITDEIKLVMKRFAGVFDLTYKRFLDLQKAEAQAREAQIEASLERVRAHAMAMHNSADLSATVNILFKELKTLGITPMRCGVGEMLEGTHTSELVFTTADHQGELYELPGKLLHEGHPVIENIYKYWKRQEEYHPVLQGTDIMEYYKVIKSQMILPEYPAYTRHFGNYFYFKEGFFFAWAEKEFTEEAMNIFRKFTSVLSLTYKRYKDLKQAEAQAEQARLDLIQIQTEKKRAEDALIELNATQAQLIQAEKMASLGELTAGIAHEIQNPLNFVNNFSEVNAELIDELNAELAIGNTQLAIEIGQNLKENEEKITFHGKRADAIVKGMLQHSRASSGVKEPTDINALADEYLRLAYHGLRAKDKTFNATMKTEYDQNIGLINIVPQDIGRVVLNLVMNAFYAVSAAPLPPGSSAPLPPQGGKGIPTVTITTRKLLPPSGGKGGEGVEIRITDNGPGIPAHLLDKIFQPFFTTKPTGQGTGLGLSLSYDIVKAHGGDLLVETEDGIGTTFIIRLPFA